MPSIDNVREFWDRRPCNIRHSNKPFGTQEYFDEVEARKYFVEPHIPRFAEFGRWHNVLEIGCGIGTETINFARYGARVTAVDVSESSLRIARQRAKVYGLEDRIAFYAGNAEELASFVPADTYDLVYTFGVIHCTPSPGRILEQIGRYTASGSTLKVMVYHRYAWKVLWILLKYGRGQFWRLPELLAYYSEAQSGGPITNTYTKGQMRDWLGQHGFRVEEMFADHIFPYRISDYVQYRYVKTWYWQLVPRPLFRWLERHFGWHLCITAIKEE